MRYKIIEHDDSARRDIRFMSYIYDSYDGTERHYRYVIYPDATLPLEEFFLMDENDINDYLNNTKQIVINISESGKRLLSPSTILPLEDVTFLTPIGDYKTE